MWGQQSQEVQQLRDEVARLAAEMAAVKKVILHFGKEGWHEQGPAQGPSWASWWAFPAQPTHPSLARGCWLNFSAVKSPFSWPGLMWSFPLFLCVFPRKLGK